MPECGIRQMKRTLKSTLTTLVLLAVLVPGSANARKHYHDDECFVPMTEWQPRAEVLRMASEKGWTVQRVKIDDGCYEIRGSDEQGRRIEVTIHPQTLEVLDIEYDSDGRRGGHGSDYRHRD
jgi:hypothetical protein